MITRLNLAAALVAAAMPAIAFADSLSPGSFSDTISVGGSTTVHKTLTITPTVTSAKVDVFFVFDTTGSMGSEISAAQSAASSIFSSVGGLGDVEFGVGEYKDGSWGGDPFQYRLDTDLTSNSLTFSTALGALSAGGGGDYPESGLNALVQAADTTSWRDGSTRIAIMFGDAPSHEDFASNPTREDTLAALNSENIIYNGINYYGLNDDPAPDDGGSTGGGGQADYLATNTGGIVQDGTASTSAIVSQITNAIDASFATYDSVSLDLSAVPSGLHASASPATITGSFDRSASRSFDFDLTLTGVTSGSYDFDVYGLVGTGRVATERDHIVVGSGGGGGMTPVPEASTYGLVAAAGLAALAMRRRLFSLA